MTPKLSCPRAEYRAGMMIYCKAAADYCGNARYMPCKGWWVLTDSAARCPLRRKDGSNERESETA